MTTIEQPATQVDHDAVMAFVFKAVEEVGASLNTAMVVIGDRLGYYRTLAEQGPTTPAELAERTGTELHYAREWLNSQAAGSYVTYDPASGRYTLPPEHAVALADESSPAFLPGLFQTALGSMHDTGEIIEAARSGEGFGWHQHGSDVHIGTERFFRPGYAANLVDAWLPALDGVVEKLTAGGKVADVGCGHGASTILMATAFPRSTFLGTDYHAGSIETARQRAEASGVADRVRFEVQSADELDHEGFDLVALFDALHDMGDPVGAARRIRQTIADDGTLLLVEPAAGDHVEDNLNPVGRTYYGFSVLLCTPNSLSQDVGLALGTQAGPARTKDVCTAAGFTRFRIAAQTPFNNVYEVRP